MLDSDRPVLVTGAAGFIGFHLALRLLREGIPVVGLDNVNDYYDVSLKWARLEQLEKYPNFSFHRMNLADGPGVQQLFRQHAFNRVIHLAAQAGVRFSLTNPHAYVESNLVRFFTVYGPWGRPDMALFLFTKAMLAGEPIKVFNHGNMQRDFTYIDDIIEGVVRIAARAPRPNPQWNRANPDPGTSYAPYRIYNIGNNQPVQLLDFIAALEEHLGIKAKMELLPMQPGDVPATYADIEDLAKDFGFHPRTTIQDGIREFVSWYREYYQVGTA
jgi:nucleoside-diphosphate-sugar epimerase